MTTECFVDGKLVSVDDALATQEKYGQCKECRKPVKAHRASRDGKQAAHFEHLVRNPSCALSDHRK